jgi:predicted ATPase
MPAVRIFISYRRDDAGEQAARIAERVRARFGADAVFLDIEAIAPGEDFVEAIERAIWDADVVLIVIGPAWLDATDAEGGRRLEGLRDYVRLEVEAALRRGVRIVPVLIGGASMPSSDELPGPLAPLARRNAVALDEGRSEQELEALLDTLDAWVGEEAEAIHLPAQPTPFIGREVEVAAVRALIERDDVRLLTLSGPGGAGKTRLSIEVASALRDRFPEGVWFVGLAALRDPELVLPTIATTLGLHEGFGSDLAETLGRFLRDRRILLVIDNVEQLLPEAASEIGDLLAAAPELRLLVSGREPLGIRAERVYAVGELTGTDALALFIERARIADPRFEPEDHAAAVGAICDRLEGLPLAIELAAARVRLLSPPELLRRLDDRLPVLTSGARDAPERQRTMRGAIAWSYDLLDPAERELFARLGVFRGGWTLDAAEGICGADLDAMGSLVDKSLVRRTGERFSMLETIREFAVERLVERPDAGDLRARHATWYLALAEGALPGLRGGGQEEWIERLEAEHDNIRAALRRSLDDGAPERALRLGWTIGEFWYLHGDFGEARAWLTEVLDRSSPARGEDRAMALTFAGWFAAEQGDPAATPLLEDALDRSLGAPPATRAFVMTQLMVFLPDDPARARMLAGEAVSLARTSDDRWVLSIALGNRAELLRADGDLAGATALYGESLRVCRAIRDRFHETLCLTNLGEMSHIAGDTVSARELLDQARHLAEANHDRRNLSTALLDLGWVSLTEGKLEESARWFRASLLILRELGTLPVIMSALTGLAGCSAAQGNDERAGRLTGAADAIEGHVGPLPTPPDAGAHVPHLETAQARCGPSWDGYVREGRSMELDAVIDYATG